MRKSPIISTIRAARQRLLSPKKWQYRKWLLPKGSITKIRNVNCSGCIGYAGQTKYGHCGSPKSPDSSSGDAPSASLFVGLLAVILMLAFTGCPTDTSSTDTSYVEPSKPITGNQTPGQGTGDNQQGNNQGGGSGWERPTEECNLTYLECRRSDAEISNQIQVESWERCESEGCGMNSMHSNTVVSRMAGAKSESYRQNDGVPHKENGGEFPCNAYVDFEYVLDECRKTMDRLHPNSRSLQPIASHVHLDGEQNEK